jgi:hypothetical protein
MIYNETLKGKIYFSQKTSNSLTKNGIYEYQDNQPKAGLYEVIIYLNNEFNLIMELYPNKPFPKRENNHLFTYSIDYSKKNLSFLKNLMQL